MSTPKRREVVLRAQRSTIERERERGIVRVLVKVHRHRRQQLEEIIGQWMLEDLAPQDVVDS